MKKELSENQAKLINMINTWIKHKAISDIFSYKINDNVITFLPKELQIEWNDFERDISTLVESGFLLQFPDNFYGSSLE